MLIILNQADSPAAIFVCNDFKGGLPLILRYAAYVALSPLKQRARSLSIQFNSSSICSPCTCLYILPTLKRDRYLVQASQQLLLKPPHSPT